MVIFEEENEVEISYCYEISTNYLTRIILLLFIFIQTSILYGEEIIFVCFGKQEFGQRALGHRSIICDPSKLDLVKKINSTIKMLKRIMSRFKD